MVFRFLRGDDGGALERVDRQIVQMLADDRHSFDLAATALLGGADPDVVGPDIRTTDRRVNNAEREIRRELVVHASVQEAVDVPAVLVYMSVVKDVERIGDYAKNVYDLAADGADFSAAEDRDTLTSYRDRVSSLITEAGQVFIDRDDERARELIASVDEMLDDFDERVSAYMRADDPAHEAVPRALYYRHLKRIAAHLMNLMSAVVMPVDQLDYYDEDRDTRD